jgi:hypothetical protein
VSETRVKAATILTSKLSQSHAGPKVPQGSQTVTKKRAKLDVNKEEKSDYAPKSG